MSDGVIGVAISTTGDEHRLRFLETCVEAWRAILPLGSVLVVTVDGTEDDGQRAAEAMSPSKYGTAWRVGQRDDYRGRHGVAASKNTGLELLMSQGVEHLFLCDDDTWPLIGSAIEKHIELVDQDILHSMVCWGKHRFEAKVSELGGSWAEWNWPRGVMLYQHRLAVERVGGMDERFGVGGHEHVEYSNRMCSAHMTPAPFCSPLVYAENGVAGAATRASTLWNAEDMPRPGEPLGNHRARRRRLTTIRRTDADWKHINRIMAERSDSSDYVSYCAEDNGRASATLCLASRSEAPSLGAGGEK